MASTTLEVSSGYVSHGTRLELILQSTSNGASANTSIVKYWLRFTKKYSADGSYAYTNGNHVYLTLNNQPIISTESWGRVDISGLGQGGYVELASGQITVSHNSDGSKTIPVYAHFYQSQRTDFDYEINTNFTLDKIDRYATVTLTVGAKTKNSIEITAKTSLACKTFNFQYSVDNGTTWKWYATDVPGYIEGAAYIYENQNTTSITHTYKNLCYATTYRFRCLVTTTAGLYTGTASVTPVTATTSTPSLATLSSNSVSAGDDMIFGISIPDTGTKYRMNVRIGSSSGDSLLDDGITNQTATSRTITNSNWDSVYNTYTDSTSGSLWIKVSTYSIDSNKYMGEKTYTVNFDFSDIDLSPDIQDDFSYINISLPPGIISNFPTGYIITGEKASITAHWDSDKITFKNGATLSGYRVTWNGVLGNTLSTSTTSFTSHSTVIGENPFSITVIDSRGYSSTAVIQTINSVEYIPPEIQLSINRNGYSTTLLIGGSCFIAPLLVNDVLYNSEDTTVEYKLSSDTNWTTINVTPSDVSNSGTYSIESSLDDMVELSSSYQVRVTITDLVGNTVTKIYEIGTAIPLFSLCDDGAVGVNCYPEDNYWLTVNGNTKIRGDVDVDGIFSVTSIESSQSITSQVFNGELNGNAKTATTATTATKLGDTSIGSGVNPIFLNNGEATSSSSTVGSGTKPIFLSNGVFTQSDSSVGSSKTPVYLSAGSITALPFKIAVGTKVITTTAGGTSAKLFTYSDINTLLGTSYTSSSVGTQVSINVTNGDGASRDAHLVGVTMLNGNAYVLCNGTWGATANLRVNYILIGY